MSGKKGIIYFAGGDFVVQFDQDFLRQSRQEYLVYLELIQRVRRRKYDDRRLCWTLAPDDDASACMSKLVDYGLIPTQSARDRLGVWLKAQAARRAAAAPTEEEIHLEIPGMAGKLKNYQKAGVKFLSAVRRGYLGDDMGLGKSLQALATLEYMNAYPAVIFCPKSLTTIWLAEARKWLPDRSASLLANDLADITIIPYHEATKYVNHRLASAKAKERKDAIDEDLRTGKVWHFPDIVKPKAIVGDEAHFIKNSSSQRTQAVKATAVVSGADLRILLSGTPIENRPKELIAQLEILGVMEKFGGPFWFAKRYCGAVKQVIGRTDDGKEKTAWNKNGASNMKELNERLREVCYIRRLKTEVLKELPDKIESVYEVEIGNRQEYQRIQRDVIAYLMEQRGELLSKSQIDAKHLTRLNQLRQAVGRGKASAIIEWVDNFLESGEKFILFAYHRDVLNAFVQGLQRWNPAMVLAGCENPKAEEQKFQTDESCRLFIGSIMSAGYGLTLTRASSIGIAELVWTHSKHKQAIDRAHRIGQKDCVNAYYFLAPRTFDDELWGIVAEKDRVVAAATNGEDIPDGQALTNLVRKMITREPEPVESYG